MRLTIGLLAAVSFLAVIPASAQGILPNSFGGWSGNVKSGLAQPVSSSNDKSSLLTAGSKDAAPQEYGFVAGETADYVRGGEAFQVNLYRMKDPSGAYGLYSYLRTTDMPRAELTEHSSMSRERALALIGNLVLEANGKDLPKSSASLKDLVAAVDNRAASPDQGIRRPN
jgi:hypothetical protein